MTGRRFNDNTKGARILRDMFQSGELTGDEAPSDVRAKHPEFEKYDVRQISQKLKKFRDLYGSSSRKRVIEARNTKEDKAFFDDGDEKPNSSELILSETQFHPLSIHSVWNDPDNGLAKRLTVFVVLPSGLGTEDVNVSTVDNGNALQIETQWPEGLSSPTVMCEPWITEEALPHYTTNHPEVVALESALKDLSLERGQNRSAPLSSTSRILLPFEVQENKVDYSIVDCKDTEGSSRSTCMVLVMRLY